jgi:F-type H+-transporting ATPase subunit epsilon
MQLEILLPFGVFVTATAVARIVAETLAGSIGLLPRRLDCVAALVPGILMYQCEGQSQIFVALDEGVLVKTAQDVRICVRNAIAGTDLAQLRQAVATEFLARDAEEQRVRSALVGIESHFIRAFQQLAHE